MPVHFCQFSLYLRWTFALAPHLLYVFFVPYQIAFSPMLLHFLRKLAHENTDVVTAYLYSFALRSDGYFVFNFLKPSCPLCGSTCQAGDDLWSSAACYRIHWHVVDYYFALACGSHDFRRPACWLKTILQTSHARLRIAMMRHILFTYRTDVAVYCSPHWTMAGVFRHADLLWNPRRVDQPMAVGWLSIKSLFSELNFSLFCTLTGGDFLHTCIWSSSLCGVIIYRLNMLFFLFFFCSFWTIMAALFLLSDTGLFTFSQLCRPSGLLSLWNLWQLCTHCTLYLGLQLWNML